MQFTMDSPFSLNVSAVFADLMDQDRDARIAAYRDPAWRARAAADLEQAPMKPPLGDLRGLRVGAVPRAGGPTGRRHGPGARLRSARRHL